MRSTRQFLNAPFKAGTRPHKKRVKAIEKFKKAHGLPALTMPAEYLDYFYHTLMQAPVDFSVCADERIVVDLETVINFRQSGKGHPLHRQPLKPMVKNPNATSWFDTMIEPYETDEELAKRITAFIIIEELKKYVAACEEKRQAELLKALDGKSDQEAKQIFALQQAVSATEWMRVYGYSVDSLPEHFYGHAPHRTVMTLPVILDGKHSIDFFELLTMLPDNHEFSAAELEEREVKVLEFKASRIASLERERDAQIAAVVARPVSEHFNEEERAQHIKSLHTLHEHRASGLQRMTADQIFPIEAEEYINPFTGMPIMSIEVNYQLLNEIDHFLDPFERQMDAVEAEAARQDNVIRKILDKKLHKKSYAQILQDEAYPADKVPESLALGGIPGSNQREIMKHPILVDGELIDLQRLQEYWKPVPGMLFGRPGCRGMNPFTKQPIKTISYHGELKDATDRFFLNRNTFKEMLNEKSVRDPNYLRACTAKANPLTSFRGGVFNRRCVTRSAEQPSSEQQSSATLDINNGK